MRAKYFIWFVVIGMRNWLLEIY